MKSVLSILLLTVFLSGCGSLIKSEYPATNYYRLPTQELAYRPSDSIRGSLLIRTFTTNSEYFSDHMQTTSNGYAINKYFYHRWVGLPEDMVTEFVQDRFSQMKLFQGIMSSSTMAVPQYILEGKLLEFIARNDERGGGTADVRVQISLVRTENMQNENPVILQRTYESKVARRDGSQQAVAEAMSRAMAEVTDHVAADIFELLYPGRSGARTTQAK